MSIGNTRECVRSKYFESKTAMEESFSDFQETKSNCKGPRTTQKVVKAKAPKVRKRIKGQKDIRTAIKGKKNDLISYTKEFDNVCKKSGLDVDSEQLQVAIALSKSLQTETDEASTSQSLTTQGRIAKIRTTLQEYGFKVPVNKITTTNKKVKRHKKQYKLLNTTEEERQSKIRNKYSELLFEFLDHKLTLVSSYQSNTPIYNIASNLEYDLMKNNDIFYVDSLANLIERYTAIGSLLRNWSEIPGRPVSPVTFDKNTMDISEIILSQDELDVVLSGPIESARKIIATKQIRNFTDIDYDAMKIVMDNKPNKVIEEENINHDNSISVDQEVYLPNTAVTSSTTEITKSAIQPYRSGSPDIFDDEMISINEISKPFLSQGEKTKVFTEETNCMDLTECACLNDNNFEQPEFISINTSKRKSNDLMEMTECAVTASQGIKHIKEIDLTQSPEEKSLIDNIYHVAQNPDYSLSQKEVVIVDGLEGIGGHLNNVDIDLTQNSFEHGNMSIKNESRIAYTEPKNRSFVNASHSNEIVAISDTVNKKMLETPCDDIDLTQSSNEDDSRLIVRQVINNKETESVDLTQSSKSSLDVSDLPEVNMGNSQNYQTDPDDTIILNEEEYKYAKSKVKNSVVTEDNEVFDLTQSRYVSPEKSNNFANKETSKLYNQSFYEDFIHDHSDSKENMNDSTNYNACDNALNASKEIVLTQSSDKFAGKGGSPRPIIATGNILNNSSLGKKDDISIDYDDVSEYVHDNNGIIGNNCNDTENILNSSRSNSTKSQVNNDVEIVDKDIDFILNCSQNSEVFDLTDKELDYSLHKSRLDCPLNHSYDFGEISVIDNNTEFGDHKKSSSHSVTDENNAPEGSFLPEVNMKQPEKNNKTAHDINTCSSPHKNVQNNNKNSSTFSIVTPKNSEYIVKTDEVTPMLDYASLTTPQRNKELDKYGLKPLKRKRAIQILTHLYNQIHPVMQPCSDEDQPSTSKKPKHDSDEPSQVAIINTRSPRKIANVKSPSKGCTISNSKSPNKVGKNMKSPRKERNSSEETMNCYEVTSEMPNIRSVDCNPEDWVFQKREKAKVHSCRVPLHIAFHNYVSSRRGLRESIIKYEPVNIDVIHKDLVLYGHRYDSKDLLRFLDKKCITVKTTDNNNRNKR